MPPKDGVGILGERLLRLQPFRRLGGWEGWVFCEICGAGGGEADTGHFFRYRRANREGRAPATAAVGDAAGSDAQT